MKTHAIAGSLLLLSMAACSTAPPPPPDTRAADEKAIREIEAAWDADWKAKNLDQLLAHYDDDGTLIVAQAPTMKGKEALRAGLKTLLSDPNLSLTIAPSVVEVARSSDLAYAFGTYSITATDEKMRKPVIEKGRYVTVYRKTPDGAWRAVQNITSPEGSPVPATP